MTNLNSESILLATAIVIGVLFLFFLIAEIVMTLQRFTKDLARLNREIHRSHPRDKAYWLKKRRRLWLSLIPFVPYKC